MGKSIAAEWLKLRRSRLGYILMALPLLSLLLGSMNYEWNKAVLQAGWYSLWTQVSLFYGEFFLPVLIAICCAYVCRLEHLNRNWNTVLTAPVPPAGIFTAKLVIVCLLILLVQLAFALLYVAAGLVLGLAFPLPPELSGWVFRGWLASLPIIAVQLGLSLKFRSFALPIGISLCAVFLGLGVYVADLGMFFPYSLLTIGMGVLSQESLSASGNALFVGMTLFFVLLFSAIAIRRLSRNDV